MRLAYLYSRYPVLSQTFCDTEMLELERRGFPLLVGSIHPPLTSIRHAHATRLQARVHYAPPSQILRLWEEKTKEDFRWPEKLVAEHQKKYGASFKPALRARNACYFAALFKRERIQHFHVHFANRAAHTALFLKEIAGIPFSITAHGQDFMSDLGNEDLLREICAAAEFVAVETDYSRGLLSARCPDSVAKIHRVYNGMDLSNFPLLPSTLPQGAVRILSVGRLVAFKGFRVLIAACAELKRLGVDFSCEIVGDGPLREALEAEIVAQQLESMVTLVGALPQQEVFEKLRSCDIFALASVIDEAGASDVFPTVILEAMAASRPVVSTTVAGIPEAVVHGLTGLLVPSGDSEAMAKAIERLCLDQWLRVTFGTAARARVEQYFQVETTIAPLMALFERLADGASPASDKHLAASPVREVAYLIERWPDPGLPLLERELLEMKEKNIAVTGFVCELAAERRMNRTMKQIATEMVFLPDASVIEAEWQANREIGYELEDDRANEKHRAPAAIFLQQARYAVALRRLLKDKEISHVHATSSRMLLCALMLKKLVGVTVSATIEAEPELPLPVIEAALAQCEGGRISHKELGAQVNGSFLVDRVSSRRRLGRSLHALNRAVGVDLAGRAKLWQEWSDLLARWR